MVKTKGNFYSRYLKRPIDFLLSLLAIIVSSPILIVAAVLVRIKLGRPILYKQERPGLNERIFLLYKFRSMTEEKGVEGNLLPDDVRLTNFGILLRATSVDELPSLLNVLKGDMSIVGPRPLLVKYLPLYNENQRRRHEVRPGLSGLAQINGRNTISWEAKFRYDLQYIQQISFWMDCKIIFLTLKKVFIKEGINSDTSATMEAFKGTDAYE